MTTGDRREDDISLRDYIEKVLAAHDRAHEAEHNAMELQAREYERRLTELNHAHARQVEDRSMYVTKAEGAARDERTHKLEMVVVGRERYEADRASDIERYTAIMQALDQRFKPLERIANRAALLFAGSAVAASILTYIIIHAIDAAG